MTLSLFVADNQNSTATATVAGADAGTTVSVYTAAMSQGQPGLWGLAAQRVGNGTLSLSGTGMFWAYALGAVGGAAALTPPVAYGCTPAEYSTHWRCLLAVQGLIQSMALSGIAPTPSITADHVYLKSDVEDPNVSLPAVLVTFENETESIEPIGFGGNEYGWPVSVWIADRHSLFDTARLPSYLNWRKTLIDNLQVLELASVPEVFNLTIEPGIAGKHVEGKQSYFLSALRVKCHSAETIAL